ncbi:hypothetical protein [Streptomyces sp. NPDC127574]|uniref:hypothetical protein n=1 Tax=Streptomyces sp. NPDC127574 TaxID=3345401 RepID=UPI003630C746
MTATLDSAAATALQDPDAGGEQREASALRDAVAVPAPAAGPPAGGAGAGGAGRGEGRGGAAGGGRTVRAVAVSA